MIAWSWSRLDTFEACPLQFYHKNILKSVPFEQNDAQIRGERIHKHLEMALATGKLDPEVAHMQPFIDQLRRIRFDEQVIEADFALNKRMESVGWFDKSVWVRIKQDFLGCYGNRAIAIDWKTGKNRGYSDQLKLYAGYALHIWPQVEQVATSYIFVDSNEKETKVFTRADYTHIWNEFGDRAERIQIANEQGEWPAKPSAMACRFCPVADCTARK